MIRQGKSVGAEKVAVFLPSNGILGTKEGDRDYPSPEKEDMIAEWAYETGFLPAEGPIPFRMLQARISHSRPGR